MMLGKRKQTTAPWEKGTLKKWPKKKITIRRQSEWAKDHGT